MRGEDVISEDASRARAAISASAILIIRGLSASNSQNSSQADKKNAVDNRTQPRKK
jgi:hypothetical protein